MPLTRGVAVGYDADLMAFKFTMWNGEQIVQCQISNAALNVLAVRGERDLPAEFEAHRDLIEGIASEQFDQKSKSNQFDSISKKETRLVRIFSALSRLPRKLILRNNCGYMGPSIVAKTRMRVYRC